MINLDNFGEYLFRMILEDNSDEIALIFSTRFLDILNEINDNISNRLIQKQGEKDASKKTYIDIDEDSNDKISFIMKNKVEDVLGRDNNLLYISKDERNKVFNARQRSTMKINRFVNELFDNEYKPQNLSEEEKRENREKGIKTKAQQLEDFVNKYKSLRKPGEFELVSGDDIVKYYNQDMYESTEGTLGNSCMKYDKCGRFVKFYAVNSDVVSLLIMKSRDDSEQIIGRALVWNLDIPEDRMFMDRIYTKNQFDEESFKEYAKEKGWLYKYNQNMDEDEYIVDPTTGEKERILLVVTSMENSPTELYPYLDTLKYYDYTDYVLSNQEDYIDNDYYKLEGTQGSDYTSTHTYEQLIEMYKDMVRNSITEYAQMYPNVFWNNIDDNRFVQDYIDGEVEYYHEDFDHIFVDDYSIKDVIKYIKNNFDEDKIPDNLDEMNPPEVRNVLIELGGKDEFIREYVEHRYKDYTAKDIYEDIYDDADRIDYNEINNYMRYFDEEDFVDELANMQDESDLREMFEE